VAALFPPQSRDWALLADVPLTPKAGARLAREAAAQGSFALAAKALSEDWNRELDGKQVQRWSQAMGRQALSRQEAAVQAMQEGRHPQAPGNDPVLLVIEVDGGRWQGKEKNPDTDSRWREDKVCAVATYLPGDGKDQEPQRLVTTYVATAGDAQAFGPLCRLEAQRRGLRGAETVLALSDGGNWTDPLYEDQFHGYVRIIDWRHAQEHLWDCAKAYARDDSAKAAKLEARIETWLWNGKVKKVIGRISDWSNQLGPPLEGDGPEHPRRVLAQNVGYFTKHQEHMDYPRYRANGWPIGSGVVEAGVKQFNKCVKGTEQFWRDRGIEPILVLRSLWLSQDDRWQRYWATRPAYGEAA
jgi:hypothetical protein